jgi:hypothetical protein
LLPLRLAKQLVLTLLAANVEWKMSYFQKSSKKTFLQRLGSVALFWGLPALCLELIGIPRQGLGSVLLIAVPVTILGVFVFALIELGVVRYIQRNFMDGKAKLGA